MDPEHLVRRAREGNVAAFVELTRRFQHAAFGSALALVRDVQQAEDVVQEAFLAAWSGLPTLADPAAFPGWLRGIVRHHAFRALRRRQLETLPLAEAGDLPSDEPAADGRLEQRQQAAAALAAIAALPPLLREPASLFFVHQCSHQDIAAFLGLPLATVNNRVHAARVHLKERIVTMTAETLKAHALPDDFANRIGRLVQARGHVVEALFDPASLPDLMGELALSDERHRSSVALQVIQRPGGGIVRAVAAAPVDSVARGATVLSSGRESDTPADAFGLDRIVPMLTGRSIGAGGEARPLETGIKVIDVMCPLTAAGSVAIAGELGTGITVVSEELVRRLSGGADRVSLFTLVPRWPDAPPGKTFTQLLKEDGYSEGTVGAVQTFFLRSGEGPWTRERLAALAPADTVIHLSRAIIETRTYPGVDVLTSRSRLLETKTIDPEHLATAGRVRAAIAALRAADGEPGSGADALVLERARKLQNFFAQPFFVAEPYTRRPGSYVSRADALRGCREILDGIHDDLPTAAFEFNGSIVEIRSGRAKGQSA
jgi:RNA polymerase sigma factor (sigma-70 family)